MYVLDHAAKEVVAIKTKSQGLREVSNWIIGLSETQELGSIFFSHGLHIS